MAKSEEEAIWNNEMKLGVLANHHSFIQMSISLKKTIARAEMGEATKPPFVDEKKISAEWTNGWYKVVVVPMATGHIPRWKPREDSSFKFVMDVSGHGWVWLDRQPDEQDRNWMHMAFTKSQRDQAFVKLGELDPTLTQERVNYLMGKDPDALTWNELLSARPTEELLEERKKQK